MVLVALVLFAIAEALDLPGLEVLRDLVAGFMLFAAHVILDLVIFAFGLFLAQLATRTAQASGVVQANLLALAAHIAILILAGTMRLRQMGLANAIITLAFGLRLGAMAVAIAFGVGGGNIAARGLEGWLQHLRSGQP